MTVAGPEPSLGRLLTDLAQKTGVLVRQEVELARTEVTAQAATAARDAAVIGAGGALAHAGLLSVITGIVVAVASLIPLWLAALLVGLVVFLAGCGLMQRGLKSLRRIDLAPRTRSTLRDGRAFLEEQMP